MLAELGTEDDLDSEVVVQRLERARDAWELLVPELAAADRDRLDFVALTSRVLSLADDLPTSAASANAYDWVAELAWYGDDPTARAQAFGNACRTRVDLAQFSRARENCLEALELEDILTVVWRLHIHTQRVRCDWKLDDFGTLDESVATLRSLLDQMDRTPGIEPNVHWAHAHAELGHASYELAHYETALQDYERAIELYEDLEPGRLPSIFLSMGVTQARLDERQQALEMYQRAERLYTELGDAEGLAAAYRAIGLLQQKEGDMAAARTAFEKALETAEAIGPGHPHRQEQIAVSLRFLGIFLLEAGQPATARERFSEALELFRALDDRGGIADSAEGLASALFALGEHDTALEYLDEAERINHQYHRREQLADTLAVRARIHRAEGDLDQARRLAEEVLTVFREVRADAGDPESRAGFSATLRRHHELYVEILMALHEAEPDEGWATKALGASERARAQSLREELELARRNQVSEDLRRQWETLRAEISQLELEIASQGDEPSGGGLAGSDRIHSTLLALGIERDERAARLDQLEKRIEAATPRLTEPEWISGGEIRRDLDEETVFLEFFLGEDRSYLWIVTQEKVDALELSRSRDEIESLVRDISDSNAIYGQVDWPTRDDRDRDWARARELYERAAPQLSEVLIAPVAERGLLDTSKRLVIVGDGALRYLSFAALPHPEDGRYLVQTHETVHLDSASVLQLQRRLDPTPERTPRTNGGIVLVASPDYQGNSSRLFYAEREAEAITELVTDQELVRLLGADATLANLRDIELGRFRVLHFATHGEVDPLEPSRSYLQLARAEGAEDTAGSRSRLSLLDIYRLRLDSTELVVLSACETAMGREIRGEGLISLARGFIYAGADTVVATLWRVHDRYTAELMAEFYRGMLEEGMVPSAALAEAQRKFIRERPDSPPYDWAGFTLQGDWQ